MDDVLYVLDEMHPGHRAEAALVLKAHADLMKYRARAADGKWQQSMLASAEALASLAKAIEEHMKP